MNDEWIDWQGGDAPLEPNVLVEVELRDGHRFIHVVNNLQWEHYLKDFEAAFDIVRYRLAHCY